MAWSAEHVCYEFGGFRLDPGRRVICNAMTGARLGIPPRIVDIALYLVQRPGELVSKERLLSGIWSGQVVEENNLTQGISQLRRALGERRGENRYVVTVPRRGYRFVADVVRIANGPSCHEPHDRSIAVLALACPGGTVADAMLAEGITSSIRHALSALAGAHVIARSPALACSGAITDAQEIGRLLDSHYLVVGNCRSSGGRIRITAQLIDAEAGTYVWSQLFDGVSCSAFDVEDEVAREVVRAFTTITGPIAIPAAAQGETTGTRKSLLSAASVGGSRP